MRATQDSLNIVAPDWMQNNAYAPAYKDTAMAFPEYSLTLPGPLPVVSHFEVRPFREDAGDPRLSADYDWITILLLTGFLLLAFVKHNFSRRLGQLIKACFVPRAVTHLYREGNPFNERISLALGLIYLLSSSLLIYVTLESFGWLPLKLPGNLWLYIAILVANASYWLLKSVASKMLAHIFKTYEAGGNYLLNNLLFNFTMGLFFLITLPLVVYTGSIIILIAVLVITSLFLAYKVLSSVFAGLSFTRFPLFYLFLYICTFEVVPLLIAVKLFRSYAL